MSVPTSKIQGLLALLKDPAINQGLLSAGGSLLQSSGYSPTPISTGQAMGGGLQAFMQGKQTATEQAINAALLKKQMEPKPLPVEKPVAVLDPETGQPTYVKESEAYGRAPYAEPKNDGRPSNVVEWEYYNSLPPEQQKRYLEMKRNTQALQMVEYGGGKGILNKSTGDLRQITDASQEAAGAGIVATATAGGKVLGEQTATAQVDLPRIEDNSRQMLTLLDQIENHPGRAQATGASAMIPMEKLAGTQARDFVALLDQVKGKQFLEAYQSLKGGGQITEVEGTKAENAIARIQDRGQSEGEYKKAISELREVVNAGIQRARKKASVGAVKRKYNPATGKIE